MMIHWNEESIRFMVDSLEHSRFAAEQAQYVLPHLPRAGHICEAGSGIGYLTLALSPHVGHVTAIEQSEEATAVLRRNIAARGIANVTAVAADIFAMDGEKEYDAMVFCRFGSMEEILSLAQKHCRGKVAVLTLANKRHRVSATKAEAAPPWCREEVLCERGIDYTVEHFTLQNGQPFRSVADAVRFFKMYDKNPGGVTEEAVREKLVDDPKGEYPYYYPMESRFRLLTFDAPE